MKITEKDNKIIMTEFDSFNIEEILECGQCFRFSKISRNHYSIIAFQRVLNILQTDNAVEFYPCTLADFNNIWIDYFDLNTDYTEIKKILSADPVLKSAIEYADGIRILNQEPWECLISFIISQNNRIPMIKRVIENISEKYGTFSDNKFLFPTIEQLMPADNDSLMQCKTGFRSKYIIDAVDKASSGIVDINNLSSLTTPEAKESLIKIKSVGEKVADCVLLFSLRRKEVFPTDVWIKRVMEYFYFNEEETSVKKIHSYAQNKWGNYAGFAQQYLFYYARSLKIGVK